MSTAIIPSTIVSATVDAIIDNVFHLAKNAIYNSAGYYEARGDSRRVYDEAIRMTLHKLRPHLESVLTTMETNTRTAQEGGAAAARDLTMIADILARYQS